MAGDKWPQRRSLGRTCFLFFFFCFSHDDFDVVAAREKAALARDRVLLEIRTRPGRACRRWVMCASSLRLKHPASEQESSRTSGKSSVLNPVRLGHVAQLPASGTSVSSSFAKGTDWRLR